VGGAFRFELYDLNTDPDQLENLAGDPDVAERQAELERQRQFLVRCASLSCDVPPFGYLDLPASGQANWLEAARWADGESLGAADHDGTFRPAAGITRGEFLNWLWRYEGSPTGSPDAGLSDVPDELAEAVNWAVDTGVVTPGAAFGDARVLTRAQAALWLWRLAGSPQVTGGPRPSDLSPTAATAPAVAWALHPSSGPILFLEPNARFRPSDPLVRSRAVIAVRRYDLQAA
jgi:hypothetical protein